MSKLPKSLRKSLLDSKKGQGMSLNTVIIAIIVLVVLVVLVMIFTGYFGKIFTPTVGSCETAGGECKTACGTDEAGRAIGEVKGAKCTTEKPKCCQRPTGGFFA